MEGTGALLFPRATVASWQNCDCGQALDQCLGVLFVPHPPQGPLERHRAKNSGVNSLAFPPPQPGSLLSLPLKGVERGCSLRSFSQKKNIFQGSEISYRLFSLSSGSPKRRKNKWSDIKWHCFFCLLLRGSLLSGWTKIADLWPISTHKMAVLYSSASLTRSHWLALKAGPGSSS